MVVEKTDYPEGNLTTIGWAKFQDGDFWPIRLLDVNEVPVELQDELNAQRSNGAEMFLVNYFNKGDGVNSYSYIESSKILPFEANAQKFIPSEIPKDLLDALDRLAETSGTARTWVKIDAVAIEAPTEVVEEPEEEEEDDDEPEPEDEEEEDYEEEESDDDEDDGDVEDSESESDGEERRRQPKRAASRHKRQRR